MHDADMKEWQKEGNYLSHQIINEQIKLLADQVLHHLSEIRGAKFYICHRGGSGNFRVLWTKMGVVRGVAKLCWVSCN